MAEGRKSHLSQGGGGNGIQERDQFPLQRRRTLCQRVALTFSSSEEVTQSLNKPTH